MYQGFNLNLQRDSKFIQLYFARGMGIYERQKRIITNDLNRFKNFTGTLDAGRIINEWFPAVKAEVFLSHSHKDERLVISLAGWLYKNFGLTSFIDSTVWGYSKKLQESIDKQYCMEPDGHFDYEKCGYSSAHVHMMLSSALTCMMDKCECLFFVNTPRSFTPKKEMQEGRTLSPWIFFEIGTSKVIRRIIRRPSNFLFNNLSEESMDESLDVEYPLDLNHLSEIDITTLQHWLSTSDMPSCQSLHPLDLLYILNSRSRGEVEQNGIKLR